MGNRVTARVGNYVILALRNYVILAGLRLGNYSIVDNRARRTVSRAKG